MKPALPLRSTPKHADLVLILGPTERARLGQIGQWSRAATDAFAQYCELVEKNPDGVVTLRVSRE